ncbi:GntR family transcriptional regulator [Paucisalibacillus sp. EB02]|uniref:GntR family transcriptional regulator n=1 Tax=Paucisalibacillus sp. EB02 TaxID=1347087 RepID=UPI0004B4F549|nr:GntR family transcriptional regulator [Paucisalibacillus sp. EB02]
MREKDLVEIKLNKDVPLPLYYQLIEVIKRDIKNGVYKAGDMIPPERELINIYGISRTPVRQALNELVTEGILKREHGRGTFVAEKKIEQTFLESLSNFQDEMESKGLNYTTRLMETELISSNPEFDAIFERKVDQLIKFIRLRSVEGEPYVLVTTYIPAEMAPGLENINLESDSLYRTLEEKYNFKISHAKRIIEAFNASKEEAEILNINPFDAIQVTKTVAYLDDDTSFEYSIAKYRGDLNRFTVHVRNKR